MKKLKPKANKLGWGYEILYKCPSCDMAFNVANNDWHFCPKCGQPLDWGVITTANEEWQQRYIEFIYNSEEKKKMLAELDHINQTLPEDIRHEMEVTPETHKQILKSNINYYLGQGWTKKELIRDGFYTEEDFKLIEE